MIEKHSRGFSLIEVLITLVILATGMLGVAALYVESLKSGYSALSRTKAINLAADMADRIRVNRVGEASYATGVGDANAAPAKFCAARNGQPAEVCTATEMANYDVWLWKTMLGNSTDGIAQQNGLAQAAGQIVVNNGTNPTTFTIQINWSEKDQGQSYTLSFAQ